MHPFFLSQAIYQVLMIIFILTLIFYEKIIKRHKLEKTKIIINFMTLITIAGLGISLLFFFLYDYSLIFPKDYWQPHNYLILFFTFLLFGSYYFKNRFDYNSLSLHNKIILIISLFYITMMIVFVPTTEKIFDRYQYVKADHFFVESSEDFQVSIINSTSSCRENTPYRKSYLIFDCMSSNSRDYYVFAKNFSSTKSVITVRLDIYDENNQVIKTLHSKKISLQPGEIEKVIFDTAIFNLPNWMQYSFQLENNFSKDQVKIVKEVYY